MRWLLILLSSGFTAHGQVGDDIVTLDVVPTVVRPGKRSEVELIVHVGEGYHIQANRVTDEFIIPTTWEIDDSQGFIVGKQFFPESKKFRLEGTDEFLDVYDGSFGVRTVVKTLKGTPEGRHRLTGKFSYQACDSLRCLAPRSISIFVELDVN